MGVLIWYSKERGSVTGTPRRCGICAGLFPHSVLHVISPPISDTVNNQMRIVQSPRLSIAGGPKTLSYHYMYIKYTKSKPTSTSISIKNHHFPIRKTTYRNHALPHRLPHRLPIHHLLRRHIPRIMHPRRLSLPIPHLQLLLAKRTRATTSMSTKVTDRGSPQIIPVSDFISLADIAYTAAAIAPALFFFRLEGGGDCRMRGGGGGGTYDGVAA